MAQLPNRSLILDPVSGKVMAEVSGRLTVDQPNEAVFVDQSLGPYASASTVLTLTRLPLSTFHPQVLNIRAGSIFPKQCLEDAKKLLTVPATYSSIFTFSFPQMGQLKGQRSEMQINSGKCDLRIRLNLSTLKVTLLSFKPLK